MLIGRGDDRGQSLVELALSLPVLLLMLIGLADVGRAFYYRGAIASGAQEGAAYAARASGATSAAVAQAACNATGFVPYNAPCPSALSVTYTPAASAAWDASVQVTVSYQLNLLSGYLVGRVFPVNPVALRASASYPLLR